MTVLMAPGAHAGVVYLAGVTFTVAPTLSVGPPRGRLFVWGAGSAYCLGTGNIANQSRPVEIMRDVAQVSTSGSLCGGYALKSDGSVWAWGDDRENQLGDGKYVNRDVPVRVPGLPAARAIAAGNAFAMIIAEDGSVWAWGDDIFWDGSSTGRPAFRMAYPTPVSSIDAEMDGFAVTGGSIEASGPSYGALGDNGAVGYGAGGRTTRCTAFPRLYRWRAGTRTGTPCCPRVPWSAGV